MANSYLQRTLSSGNRKKFTISAWVKRSKLGAQQMIINTQDDGSNQAGLQFLSGDTLNFYSAIGGTYYQLVTDRVFRDVSAWYHIVAHYDTTDSTQGDRIKIYVNGVRETSFSTATYPTQDYDTFWNQNKAHQVGAYGDGASLFFEGYLSHFAFVDGTALTPTSFGETESTSGIWKFKSPSGVTWGNNGFHLKFENSGALGTDSSGNSNTFTVNGNLKQSLDTPSNVYATLNPLIVPTSNAPTFSIGNTKVATMNADPGYFGGTSTFGVSQGKWYFEVKLSASTSGQPFFIGVSYDPFEMARQGTTASAQYAAPTYLYYGHNGNKFNNNSNSAYGNSYTTNDIIGVALDLDNHKLYFHKNGTYQNSGVPTSGSTGTGSAFDLTTGETYFPVCTDGGGSVCTYEFNFGNGLFGTTAITSAGSNGNGSLFEYDVPTGYYALNTKNINTYG